MADRDLGHFVLFDTVLTEWDSRPTDLGSDRVSEIQPARAGLAGGRAACSFRLLRNGYGSKTPYPQSSQSPLK